MKKIGMIIVVILLLLLSIGIAFLLRKEDLPELPNNNNPIDITNISDFDIKMIKETNNLVGKNNYMISPLSIAYALSLLKEGADAETLEEINNVLNNYSFNDNVVIKNKVSIANLIFVKNTYKNDISNIFINTLKTKYDSEVMFDDFKTPEKVNAWVKNKTFNMIEKLTDKLNNDFVLGLANAIAIDVEWKNKFECTSTYSQEFTKEDNIKIDVAMMHDKNGVKYIESNNAKGIIKDYAFYDKETGNIVYEENNNTIALEYLAILPNKTINEYMKVFDKDELNKLYKSAITSENKDIKYALPKYTYDFNYDDFKKSLEDLGIKNAFDQDNANFSKMINENSDLKVYVGEALHKTHIELSESGTKAAALTAFMMFETTAIEDPKPSITIEFNRPFIYLIKEKNSDNIWFFGTVYEPMLYKDNPKCEMKEYGE